MRTKAPVLLVLMKDRYAFGPMLKASGAPPTRLIPFAGTEVVGVKDVMVELPVDVPKAK
jgi:hypothetical protein